MYNRGKNITGKYLPVKKNIFLAFSFFLLIQTRFSWSQDNPSGEGIDSLLSLINSEKNDTNKINYLVKICWKYQDLGEFQKGLKYGNDALARSKKLNYQEGIAGSYNRIAEIYRLEGNYSKALENHFAALKTSEDANYENGIARANKNIGVIYISQGEYKKSLENHFAAVKIYEKINSITGIGHCYNNIGMIYAIEKNYPEALKYYNSALEIKEKTNDKKGIAAARINIGIIYNERGNSELKNKTGFYKKSLENYFSALKTSEEIAYKKGIADAYNNIGNLFTDMGDYAKANEYLEKGLAISFYISAKEYIMNAHLGLARANEKLNEFKKAHEYYKQYVLYRDSLINEDNTKKTVRLEMQYDFDKKEAVAKAESRRQRLFLWLVAAVAVAVAVIATVIFRSLKTVRRQKLIIEHQKSLVEEKNHTIEEKQKEIFDSLQYAKKIQYALLAHDELLKQNLPEHFVLFKPKDIVSGDFYWAILNENNFYLAVCDCTGHGVPGAFMSLLNISFMNEAIREKNIENPNEIFGFVRNKLIENFSKDGRQDGMDGILCRLKNENDNWKMEYSAAHNAPVIIRQNNPVELPCDKMPVGKGIKTDPFKLYSPDLQKGDCVYLFTDGYADQFGGEKKKKFKYRKLVSKLAEISRETMATQKEILMETFESWRGNLEQVDDICVIGIKV